MFKLVQQCMCTVMQRSRTLHILGSFCWFFVVAGTHKSLGVLYVDLIELFQEGAFATSLISTVFTLAWCLSCTYLLFFFNLYFVHSCICQSIRLYFSPDCSTVDRLLGGQGIGADVGVVRRSYVSHWASNRVLCSVVTHCYNILWASIR